MQVKFLLNEKLRYLQVYSEVLFTTKKYGVKTPPTHSEFAAKLIKANKKDIMITIVILEHIVRSLEKKVSELKAYTNSLHPTPP